MRSRPERVGIECKGAADRVAGCDRALNYVGVRIEIHSTETSWGSRRPIGRRANFK